MPRALTPGDGWWTWIDFDKDIPIESRPQVQVPHLSGFDVKHLIGLDERVSTLTPEEAHQELYDTVWKYVRGWKNMVDENGNELPCDRAHFEVAFGLADVRELAFAIIAGAAPSEEDLGKSGSPSSLSTALSVKAAGLDVASIDPAQKNPQSSDAGAKDVDVPSVVNVESST